MLQRMQILIDSQAKENLLWLAEERNVSVSRLVRDLANKEVITKKKTVKKNAAKMMLESAKKMEKLGLGGPPDLSTNDDYIYG